MIKLTSEHDKIELDDGCLVRNRIIEKQGGLVSKGCPFKVKNNIFNKNPQEIEPDCSMYYQTVIFSHSVYAKLIWCVAYLNQRRIQIRKLKINIERKTKEAADLLECLETS